MNFTTVPCGCQDGYQHLFGPFYRWPCKRCHGTGERPRAAWRIWTALRRGAATREDY